MRKSIWTVLFAVLITLLTAGCDMQAEFSVLQGKVNDLDKRVSTLEDAVAKINNETIPSLQNLVNALNKKLTIVSVVEGEGEYTITFSDGTTATLRDGKDGIDGHDGEDGEDGHDGEDGETPEISIAPDEDGVYYWTVNGNWLLDNEGNKVPVTSQGPQGEQGEQGPIGPEGPQGVTPLFGTSSEQKLIVSYDNGETWYPVGVSIIDGSAFTSAYIDEEKSTEDYIVLVVGETEVQIPREKTFALKIDFGDLNSVGINGGNTLALPFTVEGVSAEDDVTVDVLSATPGLNARITGSFILITADEDVNSGKVFVFADNNKGKTNIKVIRLEEGVIEAIADVSAQVSAEGGTIELTVNTNKQYNVFVSEGDEDWLSVHEANSKATHTDDLIIEVAANATGAYREGTVTVTEDATGEKIKDFVILQQPSAEVATDLASIRYLSDGTSVAGHDVVVLAASKQGALVVDEDGAYLYLQKEDNTAVRGDVVAFEGIKKTNEQTKVKYVEVSSITVSASGQEVSDLPFITLRVHSNYNSINTGASGVLAKDEKGWFVDVSSYSDYYPNVYLEEPAGLDLASLEGKFVTVKGYLNGSYVDYDESYYFTDDSFCNLIAISVDEISFEQNANWTLSYEGVKNGKEVIKNTVSGGNDYYFNYSINIYPASIIEEFGSLEALITTECFSIADLTQYWFYYYYDDIDDDAATETSEIPASLVDYGEYVVVAVGLNEDGFASGKYAVLQFTKEDPHVAAAYDEFIGDWVIDGTPVTIEQKEANVSYNLYAPGSDIAGPAEALYDSEKGQLYMVEQSLGTTGTSSYGAIEYFMSGIYKYSSTYPTEVNYPCDSSEPFMIFHAAKLRDGGFELTPCNFSNTYKSGSFVGFSIVSVLTEGQYAGYYVDQLGIVGLPADMEPMQDTAAYDKWIGNWTLSDAEGHAYPVSISMNKLNESYTVLGLNGLAYNFLKATAVFDSESGNMILAGGNYYPLNTSVDVGTGEYFTVYLYPLIDIAGEYYYVTGDALPICEFVMNESSDGASAVPGSVTIDGMGTFENAGFNIYLASNTDGTIKYAAESLGGYQSLFPVSLSKATAASSMSTSHGTSSIRATGATVSQKSVRKKEIIKSIGRPAISKDNASEREFVTRKMR